MRKVILFIVTAALMLTFGLCGIKKSSGQLPGFGDTHHLIDDIGDGGDIKELEGR